MDIVKAEKARDFKSQGIYRKRLRYFVDGVVIGSEGFVRREILRRKNPIPQLDGIHQCLREQRGVTV